MMQVDIRNPTPSENLPTPQPWLHALIYWEKEGHDYPAPVAGFQGLRKSNNAYCRLRSNLHRKRPAALGKMCQWQCRVILLLCAALPAGILWRKFNRSIFHVGDDTHGNFQRVKPRMHVNCPEASVKKRIHCLKIECRNHDPKGNLNLLRCS